MSKPDSTAMTNLEKNFYHQIHPLKLLTDWTSGLIGLIPLWKHELLIALLIIFIPAVAASLAIVRLVNLEKYRQSPFGRYFREYMSRAMELMRFGGYGLMALGAWAHLTWLILLGLAVILLAWLRGVIFPVKL